MKPKPNLDDFLGSAPPAVAATPAAPVDEAALVVMIPIEKLRPNSDQDRGEEHFETAEAREYIESLAASMSLDIGGGKKFGVRDPIKVRPEGVTSSTKLLTAKTAGVQPNSPALPKFPASFAQATMLKRGSSTSPLTPSVAT